MLRDIVYQCAPAILSGLYFRLGINLVPEKEHHVDIGGVRRICILADPEVDNPVTLAPIIHRLKSLIPDARITVAIASDETEHTFSEIADEVVILSGWRRLKKIRDDWPDLTIAAGPGGFASAKTAFRTGARYRLGFRYDHMDRPNIGFLFTHAVSPDESKSTVEQQLDLIHLLRNL